MSFTVGAWVFPLFITIAAFAWSLRVASNEKTGDYSPPVIGMLAFLAAIIASLSAWLTWALI